MCFTLLFVAINLDIGNMKKKLMKFNTTRYKDRFKIINGYIDVHRIYHMYH